MSLADLIGTSRAPQRTLAPRVKCSFRESQFREGDAGNSDRRIRGTFEPGATDHRPENLGDPIAVLSTRHKIEQFPVLVRRGRGLRHSTGAIPDPGNACFRNHHRSAADTWSKAASIAVIAFSRHSFKSATSWLSLPGYSVFSKIVSVACRIWMRFNVELFDTAFTYLNARSGAILRL